MPPKPLRIGIVAGEISGDILGAGLLAELKRLCPGIIAEGIGGPRMIEQGFVSLHPMERLSVMGIVEPLKRLPELLGIRRHISAHFIENPPDVFIGIDAPDFNLGLEGRLHKKNIRTVHYVSPSVWAWRQNRIKKIARSVDLVLTLFPFEAEFYHSNNVAVEFVGHPLADAISVDNDMRQARVDLGVDPDATVIALLPGSRSGEVRLLCRLFLDAAEKCALRKADIIFLMPAANPELYKQLQSILSKFSLPVTLVNGQSQKVMLASDVVLMASGTTTLEALLLKKPMVVAYKMSKLSHAIISRMLRVPFVSLPNLLANHLLVPELLQDSATPENISVELLRLLDAPDKNSELLKTFTTIHNSLRQDASRKAAQAIIRITQGS